MDQRESQAEVARQRRLTAALEHDDAFAGCQGMTKERKENREKAVPKQQNPAGPHARPELTEEEKTPGSGMLPEPDDPNQGPSS